MDTMPEDTMPDPADPSQSAIRAFFAGHPAGRAVFEQVRHLAEDCGPFTIRVTRSQVALRRRTGFAWVWLPGRWLRKHEGDVVLSLSLPRADGTPRFKEIAHPSPRRWMHHLVVASPEDLDGEVLAWLREAYEAAA